MGIVFWISVYLVTWWMVLFIILPLGIRSHSDEGTEPGVGHDPGAPINPNIKQKFITTTWVAALVLAVIWAVVTFGLIKLPNLPSV